MGKSGQTVNSRRAQHLRDAFIRTSPFYFHRSLRKYGADSFIWQVIGRFDDSEMASRAERLFIQELSTKIPAGYNMTDGGEGMPGCRKTPEQRAAIAARVRGTKHSLESKQKMRLAKLGRCLGPMREETKQKIREANTGKKQSQTSLDRMVETRRKNGTLRQREETRQKISLGLRRAYREGKR